jgi:putative oxidoreductase
MFTPFTPTQAFACLLLSILFLWSGFTEKLFAWSASLDYVRSQHLPMAAALLAAALCIEVLAPVLLFFRRTGAGAAMVLGLYCLATALLFHNFLAGDDSAHSQLTNFLKNLGLAGGFFYIFSDLQQRPSIARVQVARRRWPDVGVTSTLDR